MIVHHVPSLVQKVFPDYTWHRSRTSQKIYITFDDGPVPGITDKVLDILNSYNYKATFFMVGDNVQKHPTLANEVIAAGHIIGNHTYHHIKGNNSSTTAYYADFQKCQEVLEEKLAFTAKMFRPPYGRISSEQAKEIGKTHEVVMWDVLSGDYDLNLSADRILKKTVKHTQNGSIIVFHDQQKTSNRLPALLSDFLKYITDQGYLPVTL